MPIQISCPSCGQALRVPDNLLGEMVKCPKCETTFTGVAASNAPSHRPETTYETEAPGASFRAEQERAPTAPPRAPQPDDFDSQESDRPERKRLAPHRGTLVLVLGILSLTGLGILTGIPAWIMGNGDLQKMRSGVMDRSGESETNIGRILGMISTILTLIVFIPFCSCCMLGPFGHR